MCVCERQRERERERKRERERERLHYVHSASLAYEDGSVFMSGPFAEEEEECRRMAVRQWLTEKDACATCFVFGLVFTLCPWRWAGGCAWHGLRTSDLSAQACLWVRESERESFSLSLSHSPSIDL